MIEKHRDECDAEKIMYGIFGGMEYYYCPRCGLGPSDKNEIDEYLES